MSACAKIGRKRVNGRIPFGALAQQVFSLNPGIQWFALEEAGCEPRWAWRDAETGRVCGGTTAANAQLVDPLLFMVAEGYGDQLGENVANPHRLVFVVLAYADMPQIVIRSGEDAYVSVAVSPGIDPYLVATKLISFLDRYTHHAVLN